jgi:hypothetical protein
LCLPLRLPLLLLPEAHQTLCLLLLLLQQKHLLLLLSRHKLLHTTQNTSCTW